MLDLELVKEAIDEFVLRQEHESYVVDIPPNKERFYLGMSQVGDPCRRKVWYEFRKVLKKQFPARLLRLFRRGDIEEYRFNYWLRGIGFTVYDRDADGKQFKALDFEGHFSGSMDGVGKAPKKFWIVDTTPIPFLLEYKSYNDKRFKTLCLQGVQKSDPKYYDQMQLYMGYNDLTAALFCACNKNDDSIELQWVPFNKTAFDALVDTAEDILTAQSPPERMTNQQTDWRCKFCDFHGLCFKNETPEKTCRTCKFSCPGKNKTWVCEAGNEFGTVCDQYSDITKA